MGYRTLTLEALLGPLNDFGKKYAPAQLLLLAIQACSRHVGLEFSRTEIWVGRNR